MKVALASSVKTEIGKCIRSFFSIFFLHIDMCREHLWHEKQHDKYPYHYHINKSYYVTLTSSKSYVIYGLKVDGLGIE